MPHHNGVGMEDLSILQLVHYKDLQHRFIVTVETGLRTVHSLIRFCSVSQIF